MIEVKSLWHKGFVVWAVVDHQRVRWSLPVHHPRWSPLCHVTAHQFLHEEKPAINSELGKSSLVTKAYILVLDSKAWLLFIEIKSYLVTKDDFPSSELIAGFSSWRNWSAVTWHRGLHPGWYTRRLHLTLCWSPTAPTTNPLCQRDFTSIVIVSYKDSSILYSLSKIIDLNPEKKCDLGRLKISQNKLILRCKTGSWIFNLHMRKYLEVSVLWMWWAHQKMRLVLLFRLITSFTTL